MSLYGADRNRNSGVDTQRREEFPCHVSVIVPTRNRPELLQRALTRIQSQSFRDFEVIVVDDGSACGTRAVHSDMLRSLDRRFRLIELGLPDALGAGPSVSRNVGIAAARGAILTFCDDDDFWTNDEHLAILVEVFAAEPEVDLYIANQTAVACDGRVERTDWLPDLVRVIRGKVRTQRHGYLLGLADLVRGGGFAQLNILALRKATAQAIGGFWTRTSYEEDRDFFWRAADAARAIFFNPEIVAQHNVPDPARQNNLSRSFAPAERLLLSTLVSQHIAMSVASPVIQRLCQSYEGDILRRLSHYWSGQGRHALGLQYARRALAARASLKWTLYTAALMCRHALRRGPA